MSTGEIKAAILIIGSVIFLLTVSNYYQWQATKKYYPDLTWGEYFFLSDKLKILPEDF